MVECTTSKTLKIREKYWWETLITTIRVCYQPTAKDELSKYDNKQTINFMLDSILSLKWGSHLSKKICFIYFNGSPLKMIKNAFYSIPI